MSKIKACLRHFILFNPILVVEIVCRRDRLPLRSFPTLSRLLRLYVRDKGFHCFNLFSDWPWPLRLYVNDKGIHCIVFCSTRPWLLKLFVKDKDFHCFILFVNPALVVEVACQLLLLNRFQPGHGCRNCLPMIKGNIYFLQSSRDCSDCKSMIKASIPFCFPA